MSRSYTDFNKNISSTKNTTSNQTKTTDVNILLNRVRLDKKKTFIKNTLVSLFVVSLVCAISVFLII